MNSLAGDVETGRCAYCAITAGLRRSHINPGDRQPPAAPAAWRSDPMTITILRARVAARGLLVGSDGALLEVMDTVELGMLERLH